MQGDFAGGPGGAHAKHMAVREESAAEEQERTQAHDAISHAVSEKWQRDISRFPAKRFDL